MKQTLYRFTLLVSNLAIAAALSGCMAVPLVLGGATVANTTGDVKAEDGSNTPPSNSDDLKAALGGTRKLVILPTGGVEVEAAESLEVAGYQATIVQGLGDVSKQTTSGRAAVLKEACAKQPADAAVSIRMISIAADNGLGMFVGKLSAKLEVGVEVLNCKSLKQSNLTANQNIAMTFGQKIDELKYAAKLGVSRLLKAKTEL